MLNLKFIQENKDTVIRKLAVKNFDAKELVEKIIALDNERKNLQKESDNKQSEMNSISKQIGSLMKEGKKEEAEQKMYEDKKRYYSIAQNDRRRR